MDLLNESELQLAVTRIMKQTVRDGDCIIWRPKHVGRPSQSKDLKNPPSLRVGNKNNTRVPCINILWQARYGDTKPFMLDHACPNGLRCLNLDHKQRLTRTPTPRPKRRTYARHTSECPGPDPILIERLATAGTFDVISKDHVLCDCERAWLLNNTDFPLRDLNMSAATANKIRASIN